MLREVLCARGKEQRTRPLMLCVEEGGAHLALGVLQGGLLAQLCGMRCCQLIPQPIRLRLRYLLGMPIGPLSQSVPIILKGPADPC